MGLRVCGHCIQHFAVTFLLVYIAHILSIATTVNLLLCTVDGGVYPNSLSNALCKVTMYLQTLEMHIIVNSSTWYPLRSQIPSTFRYFRFQSYRKHHHANHKSYRSKESQAQTRKDRTGSRFRCRRRLGTRGGPVARS
jgi:hypothetical protein